MFTRLCDEATSALDSTTEASILNSLMSLSVDRTSIFIAHRLTTASLCDEVFTFVLIQLHRYLNDKPEDAVATAHEIDLLTVMG
jgi:ABC transporter ATM